MYAPLQVCLCIRQLAARLHSAAELRCEISSITGKRAAAHLPDLLLCGLSPEIYSSNSSLKLATISFNASKDWISAHSINTHLPTMHVLELSPMKESLSTCVSLLALNGTWAPLRPSDRIHSFNASKDLLISAPSIRVCLLELCVSFPLSLPVGKHNHKVLSVCYSTKFYKFDGQM